jgi:adenosine deaminase
MKHNQNAEIDLDYITLAILRGMERALLEYNDLRAGIIFCLAREFDFEKNKIIVEKAIKYHRRGVVGIDVAGPADSNFKFSDYAELFQKAKDTGLKVTVHAGEVDEANDMREAIESIHPQRIGHGIKAAYDKELMNILREKNIVLEICPLSNLMTRAVRDLEEMKFILRAFVDNGVKFTINTDWPEVIENAHLWKQFKMLKEENILTDVELKKCTETAFEATFIPEGGLNAYL